MNQILCGSKAWHNQLLPPPTIWIPAPNCVLQCKIAYNVVMYVYVPPFSFSLLAGCLPAVLCVPMVCFCVCQTQAYSRPMQRSMSRAKLRAYSPTSISWAASSSAGPWAMPLTASSSFSCKSLPWRLRGFWDNTQVSAFYWIVWSFNVFSCPAMRTYRFRRWLITTKWYNYLFSVYKIN